MPSAGDRKCNGLLESLNDRGIPLAKSSSTGISSLLVEEVADFPCPSLLDTNATCGFDIWLKENGNMCKMKDGFFEVMSKSTRTRSYTKITWILNLIQKQKNKDLVMQMTKNYTEYLGCSLEETRESIFAFFYPDILYEKCRMESLNNQKINLRQRDTEILYIIGVMLHEGINLKMVLPY